MDGEFRLEASRDHGKTWEWSNDSVTYAAAQALGRALAQETGWHYRVWSWSDVLLLGIDPEGQPFGYPTKDWPASLTRG